MELTIRCTPAAIEKNDPDGSKRRAGVDFTRLPVTGQFQWVDTHIEACVEDGRLLVREHPGPSCFNFGARTIAYPIVTNPDRALSHRQMLLWKLGNP